MRVLNILSSAWRATSEEQDDTVLWLVQALRNAGAEADILLRGSSVGYAVGGIQPVPLTLGTWTQRNPPDPRADLGRILAHGGRVFVLAEDLAASGIARDEISDAVAPVEAAELPALFERYDRVWSW